MKRCANPSLKKLFSIIWVIKLWGREHGPDGESITGCILSSCIMIAWCGEFMYQQLCRQGVLIGHGFDIYSKLHIYQHATVTQKSYLTAWNAWPCQSVLMWTYLLQDMLLKRAADIAEALYSVPRPHSQLQALPSSPAHGSVMGLGSYPSQLGVSIGEPGQNSQGKQSDVSSEAHPFPGRSL